MTRHRRADARRGPAHRRLPRRHAGHLERARTGQLRQPYVDFAGVDAHPRPVQAGGPRVIVGGHTPAAYRRAVRTGHGWYGYALTPDATAACVAGLKRPPTPSSGPAELGPLEITVTPRGRLDAAGLEAFTAAGVDVSS